MVYVEPELLAMSYNDNCMGIMSSKIVSAHWNNHLYLEDTNQIERQKGTS